MRYLAVIFMLFALAANVAAQGEQTIFNGEVKSGGFGGPVVKFTSINDQSAVMVGGRGGWVINHSFVIGGGGYGEVTKINAPAGVMSEERPLDLKLGYGGLDLEYIVHPNSLAHFSAYTFIGCGTARYVDDAGAVTESDENASESDLVFVLEPALNAELNVTSWFHLSAGVSYRLVNGVDLEGLKNSDLSGMAATLTLKFGTF
jgi:hypothetical protein